MFPIIDLFAGPGGLNEGFSSVKDRSGNYVFETLASFEMNSTACQTLRLRAAYRTLVRSGSDLAPYYDYIEGRKTWDEVMTGTFKEMYLSAQKHVYQVELGEINRPQVDEYIESQLGPESRRGHWALIGGPPCQAYSLAGRSRRTGDETFASDHKHFLYREYLHILGKFKPSIFVMENVTGLLSSKNGAGSMFQTILDDLKHLEGGTNYEIRSLVVPNEPNSLIPTDFVIKAEDFGIPQKRHRVILLGVRSDIASGIPLKVLGKPDGAVTVRSALEDLPKAYAVTSKRKPKKEADWQSIEAEALQQVWLSQYPDKKEPADIGENAVRDFKSWIHDERILKPIQHVPRAHMISDLARYRVMAELAKRLGKSPKYTDLPIALHPEHGNIGKSSTPFTDRFRVQVWDSPATTVVSHISKDGHYYIHPDPRQTRSLTVREAARLQSFPDNYFFEGPRTQQFHQVGNAVPPYLARQIGRIVAEMLENAAHSQSSALVL